MIIESYKFRPSADIHRNHYSAEDSQDLEGRIYTPFGLVTFNYFVTADRGAEGSFELWLSPRLYRNRIRRPFTQTALKLFAQRFAKECWRLHQKKRAQ